MEYINIHISLNQPGSVWSFLIVWNDPKTITFQGARWHDTWMLASMIILILFQVSMVIFWWSLLKFIPWVDGFMAIHGSLNPKYFLLNHETYDKNMGL